eukprot:jgi/Tetstr1/454713/TSEL_041599.t1
MLEKWYDDPDQPEKYERVEVQVEWNPTLSSLRDAMARLHPTLLYFVCPTVDTWNGSSGGMSLGALRLGGGNVEAGGVATQEEIVECTCSGGSTCQGVYVDAKGGCGWRRCCGVANVVCWVYTQEETRTSQTRQSAKPSGLGVPTFRPSKP